MPKSKDVNHVTKGRLTADEAEKLFSTVDDTGHTDVERARMQRKRRKEVGHGVDIDPLAGVDPSGSDVEQRISRTAIFLIVTVMAIVLAAQIGSGLLRRYNTATLAEEASVTTVVTAMGGGVEWGEGFTQFSPEFTVQEADENTHRIEVSVVDVSSDDELQCFAASQIQAAAFSTNALLNPNINTVIYHVSVHRDEEGNFQHQSFFGFLQPKGAVRPFMTFVWTKVGTDDGVRFNCTITGVDDEIEERLRKSITSKGFMSRVVGDEGDEKDAKDVEGTTTRSEESK